MLRPLTVGVQSLNNNQAKAQPYRQQRAVPECFRTKCEAVFIGSTTNLVVRRRRLVARVGDVATAGARVLL